METVADVAPDTPTPNEDRSPEPLATTSCNKKKIVKKHKATKTVTKCKTPAEKKEYEGKAAGKGGDDVEDISEPKDETIMSDTLRVVAVEIEVPTTPVFE